MPVYDCANCHFQFLPTPDYDLREYYRTEYRQDHSCALGKDLTPKEQFELLRPLMREREHNFREHIPEGAKVLEIGCASGFFLDSIRDTYSVYGNEWNPDDAEYMRSELGIECSEEDLMNAFPDETFTAICAFHVLEHVVDPIGWLRMVKTRLVGGGYIYFEVPNLESILVQGYDIPEYQDRWYRKPHLSNFTSQTLARALGTLGFEARVWLREDYSLANHLRWLFGIGPDEDIGKAMRTFFPVEHDHPAAGIINRFFMRIEREYKGMLDGLKAQSTLVAIGRKREI